MFSAITTGILLCAGIGISSVSAEEQADHSMHDMSGMHDMNHMGHMDHSMHQSQLTGKGTYSATTKIIEVPDVKLVDVNRKQIAVRDLLDEQAPVMLNFIFTTCTTICPVMSATFQQVQDKLGPDRKNVRLVSISIDPEYDTPTKLKAYAAKYKAGPQWTLLTGSLENSTSVQKIFGVLAGEKMNHKPLTFLKAKGSVDQWVRIEGLADADQIIKEYDKLIETK
jgi:protein SCO1/2